MSRDTLAGLISSASNEERITAPIPIPTLNELLGDDAPRGSDAHVDVVVRFTPQPTMLVAPAPTGVHLVERSHWIVAITATALVLIGTALIFFA